MLLVTLAVATSVVAPVAATAAADDKTILLIYADARLIPAIVTADHAIRSTIQSRWPSPVRFYTEYLDLRSTWTSRGSRQKGRSVSSAA